MVKFQAQAPVGPTGWPWVGHPVFASAMYHVTRSVVFRKRSPLLLLYTPMFVASSLISRATCKRFVSWLLTTYTSADDRWLNHVNPHFSSWNDSSAPPRHMIAKSQGRPTWFRSDLWLYEILGGYLIIREGIHRICRRCFNLISISGTVLQGPFISSINITFWGRLNDRFMRCFISTSRKEISLESFDPW